MPGYLTATRLVRKSGRANPMQTILKITLGLMALLFLAMGATFIFAPHLLLEMWALNPASAENPALAWSTVRGDLGALFVGIGATLGLGVINSNRTWIQASMILMGTVFIGRAVGLAINGGDPQIYLNMGFEAGAVILMWLYTRGPD